MMQSLSIQMINLVRANKRRTAMIKQLDHLNLDYQIFSAIDGKKEADKLAHHVDNTAFQRHTGRKILPGEIGVYMSHITLWQEFLLTKKDILLVLEDDVIFHDDFNVALRAALDAKLHWDFLKLNKIRAKQPICQKRIGQYHINAYIGPATGLGAYLIGRDLIEELLPKMLPISRPIDHELDRIHIHKFRHFGLEPFPSHVDDGGYSTITGENFNQVIKPPKYKRIPSYALRFYSQIRRIIYLLYAKRIFTKKETQQH